jgi:hypothetical protein
VNRLCKLVAFVKEHVRGLAAIHDLVILHKELVTSDAKLSGDDCHAVVQYRESLAVARAQGIGDVSVNDVLSLEVSHVVVE